MAKIHPTAVVDPGADLADDVQIGPHCVVESDVRIGAGTVLRDHVVVRRFTTLGKGNFVDAFTALGGEPQDFKFDRATVSYLQIGDENVFREGVTISRATGQGNATTVGSRTFWMATSHAGHNCTVEDEVVLVNGALLGGHVTVQRKAIISGNMMVHQYCWIGEMVMGQGQAGIGMHVPPYTLVIGVNNIAGLNVVGLRRSPDLTREDIRQIREAFDLFYRSGLPAGKALAEVEARDDWGVAAGRFRDFIRRALTAEKPFDRGVCSMRKRRRYEL